MRLRQRAHRGERRFDDVYDTYNQLIRRGESITFQEIEAAANGKFRLYLIDVARKRIAEKFVGYESVDPLEGPVYHLTRESVEALQRLSVKPARSPARLTSPHQVTAWLARIAKTMAMGHVDVNRPAGTTRRKAEAPKSAPQGRKKARRAKVPGPEREYQTEASRLINKIRRLAEEGLGCRERRCRLKERELQRALKLTRDQLGRFQREQYTKKKQLEMANDIKEAALDPTDPTGNTLATKFLEELQQRHRHPGPDGFDLIHTAIGEAIASQWCAFRVIRPETLERAAARHIHQRIGHL
jgi:hypothetical protein